MVIFQTFVQLAASLLFSLDHILSTIISAISFHEDEF